MSREIFPWPDLPTKGFISQKAATQEDVESGDAVFSLNGLGTAADIGIPQYVFWRDDRGVDHPYILVQAEYAPNNTVIVGLRGANGQETAATIAEIKLLGTRKPN